MNRVLRNSLLLAAFAVSTPAIGATYSDATGENFTGAGGGILDIVQVEVTNDATDLAFTFTLAGDIVATDWGKYLVGIDSASGGDTTGNGWNRPISMSSGMDHWIGSWVDWGDGAELYTWGGASWGPAVEATYNGPPNNDISIGKTTTTVTVTVPLANLGLGIGDSFLFDAYTSGGGATDSAVDALSSNGPSIGDWDGPYDSSTGDSGLRMYTVVPEPVTLGLLGFGSLAIGLGCRRRRR